MSGQENQNTQIFGRKIFFISATFTLNTNVILRLMDQEYEVYKIDDFRQLRSILTLNPDSIVFINADSTNTPNTWYNLISNFENDPAFEKVDFGVFESKLKKPEKERFTSSLKLKAGFYSLEKTFGEIVGELLGKLEELKAKGIRQFVRYSCANNKACEAYFVNGNMMYKMQFIDISSIGVGLLIPQKYAPIARINYVIQGLTLVLGSKQLKVNAKIHTIKALPTGILAVLIYTPDTTDNFRKYLRTYICESLQKELMNSIISLPWDKTDYTVNFGSEEKTSASPENMDKASDEAKEAETSDKTQDDSQKNESTSQEQPEKTDETSTEEVKADEDEKTEQKDESPSTEEPHKETEPEDESKLQSE